MFDPLYSARFKANNIEAASRCAALEVVACEPREVVSGGAQQPLLFSSVYTGGSTTMAVRTPVSDFDEYEYGAVSGDQVDFAAAAVQIAR